MTLLYDIRQHLPYHASAAVADLMTYPLALHHQYGTLLLLSDSISRSIFQFLKMIFHSVCRTPASHSLQLLQQFCSMDVFQLLFIHVWEENI